MNEDYVSYEIAKKLKEKGYPQKSFGKYSMAGACYFDDGRFYEDGCIANVEDCCSAPTISQVLKWLRERETRIDIVVYPIDRSTAFIGGEIYTIAIYIDRERDIAINRNGKDKYRTYEQAALAGIWYVIDNLI